MELSAAGLDLLKRSEGFRPTVYLDINGYRTIGYGHRVVPPQAFPQGIDDAQATAILESDVRTAEAAVLRLVTVPLTQGQFDALTDFTFNLGAGRLAESTLLKLLNQGRYQDAAQQLLRWDIAAGEQNAGLRARREAELQLWEGTTNQ